MKRWQAKVYRFFVPLREGEWLINGKPCKFTTNSYFRNIRKISELMYHCIGIPVQPELDYKNAVKLYAEINKDRQEKS